MIPQKANIDLDHTTSLLYLCFNIVCTAIGEAKNSDIEDWIFKIGKDYDKDAYQAWKQFGARD